MSPLFSCFLSVGVFLNFNNDFTILQVFTILNWSCKPYTIQIEYYVLARITNPNIGKVKGIFAADYRTVGQLTLMHLIFN